MALPAYGLYSSKGDLVATVRAKDAKDAGKIFRTHGLHGVLVKRI